MAEGEGSAIDGPAQRVAYSAACPGGTSVAASSAPNPPPRGLASPPTRSTQEPSGRNTLETATLRLVTGQPLTVVLPKLRPWFNPGEQKAAKRRRRALARAAAKRLR